MSMGSGEQNTAGSGGCVVKPSELVKKLEDDKAALERQNEYLQRCLRDIEERRPITAVLRTVCGCEKRMLMYRFIPQVRVSLALSPEYDWQRLTESPLPVLRDRVFEFRHQISATEYLYTERI